MGDNARGKSVKGNKGHGGAGHFTIGQKKNGSVDEDAVWEAEDYEDQSDKPLKTQQRAEYFSRISIVMEKAREVGGRPICKHSDKKRPRNHRTHQTNAYYEGGGAPELIVNNPCELLEQKGPQKQSIF
uniref:Uncharacterized protein n=1 Tax=Globodera rostochiensis TaxID=31243 RepID=A0A914IAG5_GLORO